MCRAAFLRNGCVGEVATARQAGIGGNADGVYAQLLAQARGLQRLFQGNAAGGVHFFGVQAHPDGVVGAHAAAHFGQQLTHQTGAVFIAAAVFVAAAVEKG